QGFGGPKRRVVGKPDLDPVGLPIPVQSGIHLHFRSAATHVGGKLSGRPVRGKRKPRACESCAFEPRAGKLGFWVQGNERSGAMACPDFLYFHLNGTPSPPTQNDFWIESPPQPG